MGFIGLPFGRTAPVGAHPILDLMNPLAISSPRLCSRALFTPLLSLLLATALWSLPRRAHAQLYVRQFLGAVSGSGIVGEYNAGTGAAINSSFITSGLSSPYALALSGSDLLVANYGNGTVGEYNASTGAVINASFITGLGNPIGLTISGNNLFVADNSNGTISEYNASTGASINASFITGLNESFALTVSGNDLYVAYYSAGYHVGEYNATTGAAIAGFTSPSLGIVACLAVSGNNLYISKGADHTVGEVGEYDATTGAVINANFIGPGSGDQTGLAILGNDLFEANEGFGTVTEYDATTGATINVISGLGEAYSLAVAAPEPDSAMLTLLGSFGLLLARRKRPSAL